MSVATAWPRARTRGSQSRPKVDGLTIIRPLSGLEPCSEAALRSTFELQWMGARLLFCVAQLGDPVVPLVRQLIAEYPDVDAELLVGNEQICANPKLNNLIKGWKSTINSCTLLNSLQALMNEIANLALDGSKSGSIYQHCVVL